MSRQVNKWGKAAHSIQTNAALQEKITKARIKRAAKEGQGKAVLEVGSSQANLAFWQQGDAAMQTDEAIEARATMRKNPEVTAVLQLFWETAQRSMQQARRSDEVQAAAEAALTSLEAAEAEAAEARRVLAEVEEVWRGRVQEARGEAEAARVELTEARLRAVAAGEERYAIEVEAEVEAAAARDAAAAAAEAYAALGAAAAEKEAVLSAELMSAREEGAAAGVQVVTSSVEAAEAACQPNQPHP